MPGWRFDFVGDEEAEKLFNQMLNSVSEVVSFSFGQGIVAVFKNRKSVWTRLPKSLESEISKNVDRKIRYISTSGNRYYVRFDDGKCIWNGNRAFEAAIQQNKSSVRMVAFAPRGGWFILFDDGNAKWHYLPRALHLLLTQKSKSGVVIKRVATSPDGYWYVSFVDGTWCAQTSSQFDEALESLQRDCMAIDNVWLGYGGAFVILYGCHMKTIPLSPNDILFSKNTIPAHFDDCSVWKMVSELKKKKLSQKFVPPIRVVKKENKWISLDNRRLFVFQKACISEILVIVMTDYKNLETVNGYVSTLILQCNCDECDYRLESTPEMLIKAPVQPGVAIQPKIMQTHFDVPPKTELPEQIDKLYQPTIPPPPPESLGNVKSNEKETIKDGKEETRFKDQKRDSLSTRAFDRPGSYLPLSSKDYSSPEQFDEAFFPTYIFSKTTPFIKTKPHKTKDLSVCSLKNCLKIENIGHGAFLPVDQKSIESFKNYDSWSWRKIFLS